MVWLVWLVTVPRRKVIFKSFTFAFIIEHHVLYLASLLNMALLLRVVNEGEHVVVNQVAEEVNLSIEVGSDNCGTSQEPDFSVNQGKPRMHTTLPCILQIDFAFASFKCFK